MKRRMKLSKLRKLAKRIKPEKGTKWKRGRNLEMSGDMSNEHRNSSTFSYEQIQGKLVTYQVIGVTEKSTVSQ